LSFHTDDHFQAGKPALALVAGPATVSSLCGSGLPKTAKVGTLLTLMDDPKIEHRAVDHIRTITCPACGQVVELPRTERVMVDGTEHQEPMLVAIHCKFCDAEIRLTDE
jgi:hypothetical protein